jgi:hypothetical protein
MIPIDLVLSRLDHPREVARGRWRACCPAHEGKNRTTLAISKSDEGSVLLFCHVGCTPDAIVGAIGLDLKDLFPPPPKTLGGGAGPMRQPFIPAQVFDLAQREILVAWVIANEMRSSGTADDDTMERLTVVSERLHTIGTNAYGRG